MNQTVVNILQEHGVDPGTAKRTRHASIVNISIPAQSAVALWQSLRACFDATGVWPIIRGETNEYMDDFQEDPAETLMKVPEGSPSELLAPRLAERIEVYGEFVADSSANMDPATFAAKLDASNAMSFGGARNNTDPWPAVPPRSELSFYTLDELQTSSRPRHVPLALLSLAYPHEAPAHLSFGGWNDAPMPELQVAMLRE